MDEDTVTYNFILIRESVTNIALNVLGGKLYKNWIKFASKVG